MSQRYVGIDIGAETVKVVELTKNGNTLEWTRRKLVEHHKEPGLNALSILREFDWEGVTSAAVSGRFSRQFQLSRIPTKQAQAEGFRFLVGDQPATIVSIGSHGFSVLEMRASGAEIFRENSRCSQGTGNFLRQLVERFDLSIEEASDLCAEEGAPAALSGRCPVILKTDMTHLANKGESRAQILAGLYDAVCENVQVLIKPSVSPPNLVLIGGVNRSKRIRGHFRNFVEKHEMNFIDVDVDDALFFEALGNAVLATELTDPLPKLEDVLGELPTAHLESVSSLTSYLSMVKRMPKVKFPEAGTGRQLVLGFDIGSTGSKAVAVDCASREIIWEDYTSTSGNPVGAAQFLMQKYVDHPVSLNALVAFGATGSGREIVGSLLSTAYGVDRVYILNEIAAHAEGALHFDRRVDTIFEIGGQDAKYIRLADGRVIDAAMNEACSAGTGSFIEEQGRKFQGIDSVAQLGEEAVMADSGVSLGQHCSVFMAEIIDEAVAAGVQNRSIIAGIYDSIIQNYLNRVKGSRSVGDVIFCQGMPFASDALAAAVARQTGSQVIIPPNPGTVGALGICLLTLKAINAAQLDSVCGDLFLEANVTRKDTFNCKSNKGCGGAGNKCRIDRISTVVGGQRQRFTWGGGCSLWDKGTGKVKLPDRAPNPFNARAELIDNVVARVSGDTGRQKVALTDEFQLKTLFPFFATFIKELGYDVLPHIGASQEALKKGIEKANVPFCAPMQHYHGMVSKIAETNPDFIFIPMVRDTERHAEERKAVVCPVVQGSSDLLLWDLKGDCKATILTPIINVGMSLESKEFTESCARVAASLGVVTIKWWKAYEAALAEQIKFQAKLLELGREALEFAAANDITPVVVLGRPYTIHNKVLNSNVPALLREQGALAIPVDCMTIDEDVPHYDRMYWSYGQRNLRAAHQIRRTPKLYSIWCSNYSCGPDSFNLHFYSYTMEGKPFAIIETDGHSGDAGTKTRVEAFLHCVREDLEGFGRKPANDFKKLESSTHGLGEIRRNRETILIPRMGPGAAAIAAAMRGIGVSAEALPMPDHEALRTGRRYTSGKECVPMTITLGSLLERLDAETSPDTRFSFFMPTADGPCRFGVYNVLHKIVLERLGWKDRVTIWSPPDSDYFVDVPAGFAALVYSGFASIDMLQAALYDVRPMETEAGAANALFAKYEDELLTLMEAAGHGDLSLPTALIQVAGGKLFGCADLLRRAGVEFARLKLRKPMPSVMVVGEIYARCDPFANDFVVEKLEARGIKVRFAPFTEWLEYTEIANRILGQSKTFGDHLSTFVQRRIQTRAYNLLAEKLEWPHRTSAQASVDAAAPYIRKELVGEAVLTIGGPLAEFHEGLIDGVVSVGPLECMPTKLAESQFFHIAEKEGLISLTIPLNGDPVDPEMIDNFAFEVHAKYGQRDGRRPLDLKSGSVRVEKTV